MIDAAGQVPEVLREPPPSVRVRELGAADIVMELRFWTDSRRTDLLATTSAVRARVVQAVRTAGLSLPQPDVRRIVIEQGTGDGGPSIQARGRQK